MNSILFAAPNSYVVRNWVASGLADLCEEQLGLVPEFLTHFSDTTFQSPGGRKYLNHFIPVSSDQREMPADFPKILYAIYYLRLRTAALEIENGSIQLMNFARKRDPLHYFLRGVSKVFPRGTGRREAMRRLIDSINPRHETISRIIQQIKPKCVIVGSPGLLFLDQLVIIEARRRHIPVHCIVNSWDNMTSRGSMIRRPNSLMVWNHFMRDQAIELHQFKSSKIHIVGSLQFSQYAEPVNHAETAALYARIGLPLGTNYLLVLTGQHVPEYEAEDVTVLLDVLSTSQYAKMPVVVRVHPQTGEGPFRAINHPNLVLDCPPRFSAKGEGGLRFDKSEMRAMAALLSNSSFVFSSWGTTALLEAAIFDRPMIQLRWMDAFARKNKEQAKRVHDFQKYRHLEPLDKSGCRIFCDSPKTLVDEMQRLCDEDLLFREKRRHAVEILASPPLQDAPMRVIKYIKQELAID